MTTEQIKLVKRTWRVFMHVSPATLGELFYSKLFSDNPSLRKIFPGNKLQQYQKSIDTLNAIVMRLDKPDELTEEVAAMARRHLHHGARLVHYKLAGSALLWTLQKGLGEDWNDDVQHAWTACFTVLANTMMNTASFAENAG
ncbi:MAG: globin domain-containing protein [Bacteroidota bacterium]